MKKDKGALAALIVGKMKPKETEEEDGDGTDLALEDASGRMMAAMKADDAAGFGAALGDFLDIRSGISIGEDDE